MKSVIVIFTRKEIYECSKYHRRFQKNTIQRFLFFLFFFKKRKVGFSVLNILLNPIKGGKSTYNLHIREKNVCWIISYLLCGLQRFLSFLLFLYHKKLLFWWRVFLLLFRVKHRTYIVVDLWVHCLTMVGIAQLTNYAF